MPPADNLKIKFIALAILVILLVAAGFWYWYQKRAKVLKETSRSAQFFGKVQNPMEKLPETNPFKVQSNPFSADANPLSSSNPFNEIYKNPFGQ
ncbi:MAG: hypothetical protein Q7R91_00335 [bacterium]|nr:hypothetical protein [bacterium]